jgi:hypothetical protein
VQFGADSWHKLNPNGCSSDSTPVGQRISPWIDLAINGHHLRERERGHGREKRQHEGEAEGPGQLSREN